MKLEKGELKPFSEKEKLPSISIPSYDPRGREGVIERAEESVADKNPLYGFHRFSKSVTFTEEVDLNGALIYVDGDVVLDKPLKGTGALVATGKVTLRGGAAMKADSLAAVLAGDDLTIAGKAGVPSNFTGLLYLHRRRPRSLKHPHRRRRRRSRHRRRRQQNDHRRLRSPQQPRGPGRGNLDSGFCG